MRKPWYSFLFVRSPIAKIIYGIAAVIITIGALLFQQIIEEPRMAAQTASWDGRSIEQGAEIYFNNCYSCHGLDGKGLMGVAPALNSKYFFTQRLEDVEYTGTMHDYVAGTIGAGRPSKFVRQWAQMMPVWGVRFGGPLRDDQVEHITKFVLNWEAGALQQSWDPESDNRDPWQPFQDAPSKAQTGSITYTVGTLGVAAVTAEQVAGAIVTPTETVAVSVSDQTPAELFLAMGCMGCHQLGPHEVGITGPDLNPLPDVAASRVPGEDAETYVYNSIVHPNDYINEGYGAGIMPANFSDRMSEEQIRAMVAWLLDPDRSYD